jgi:hypothetical protein
VEKLIADGSVTEHGLRVVEVDRKNGCWEKPVSNQDLNFRLMQDSSRALLGNGDARVAHENLVP